MTNTVSYAYRWNRCEIDQWACRIRATWGWCTWLVHQVAAYLVPNCFQAGRSAQSRKIFAIMSRSHRLVKAAPLILILCAVRSFVSGWCWNPSTRGSCRFGSRLHTNTGWPPVLWLLICSEAKLHTNARFNMTQWRKWCLRPKRFRLSLVSLACSHGPRMYDEDAHVLICLVVDSLSQPRYTVPNLDDEPPPPSGEARSWRSRPARPGHVSLATTLQSKKNCHRFEVLDKIERIASEALVLSDFLGESAHHFSTSPGNVGERWMPAQDVTGA